MKRRRAEDAISGYRGRSARMGRGRLTAGAVCALAGVLLLLVRPWGLRFSGFLLLGAAAVLALSVALDRLAERGGWRKALRRAFYLCLTLGLAVLCAIESFVIDRGNRDMTALPVDAVIVLGAGVNGRKPSLALETRLEAALTYLEDHPDVPVVLTGGLGYGEEISEARCMFDWLAARGVDPKRLLLEEKSANTAENFSFSHQLIRGWGIDPSRARVAVVTNDFHLARAQLIGEKTGYGAVIGVPARLPWVHLTVNYHLREAFAIVKTVILD